MQSMQINFVIGMKATPENPFSSDINYFHALYHVFIKEAVNK